LAAVESRTRVIRPGMAGIVFAQQLYTWRGDRSPAAG